MPVPDPLFLTGQNLAFAHDADTVSARLTAHARTMGQGVYQVAERFYVAVGYGNANMAMVVGTGGVILIDSLENAEAAREALHDLRRFSDKPIKALIYTHSHPDHSSGARGLFDPSEVARGQIAIYAHERLTTGTRGNPSLGIVSPLRLAYSFGWGLESGADGLVADLHLDPPLQHDPHLLVVCVDVEASTRCPRRELPAHQRQAVAFKDAPGARSGRICVGLVSLSR